MNQYIVKEVKYFTVNGKKFPTEEKAEEYATKLFLVNEVSAKWAKKPFSKDMTIYLDDLGKHNTIVVKRDYENGKFCEERYSDIGDFYNCYKTTVDQILKQDVSYLVTLLMVTRIKEMLKIV